jgi:ABC-2 type transport system ATP-binding protein
VGILTENPGLYEGLSARKNLEIFANLYDVEAVDRQVEKYLKMLGLWSRREDPVGSFSKGMRQKLSIARSLLHEPQLLFLDEPTTNLDPEASRMVRQFIQDLRDQGRTIFMCTHNLNEADQLCDRIGIFKTRLITVDTPTNLRQEIFGRKVVFHLRIVDPAWVSQLISINGVNDVERIDQKLVISLEDPETINPKIIRILVNEGADIQFVGELRHSLEEIYLQMMQNSDGKVKTT